MKKTFLLLLVVFGIGYHAQADSRFFTVIFADTDDPRIGRGAKSSMAFMENMFQEIAVGIDIPEECTGTFYGSQCNKSSLMKWLRSFNCSSEDIVIFCYLGHGIRSPKDTSIFPQMCLGGNRDDQFVSLEAVKNELMAKGPKFALVIGDCCNSYHPNVSPKFVVEDASSCSSVSKMQSDNLKKLFLEQTGCVITTGSKAGEYSWAHPLGMIYTRNFTEMFHQYTAQEKTSTCSWSDFLGKLQTKVGNIPVTSADDGGTYYQHPIYRLDRPNPKTKPNPDRPKPPVLGSTQRLLVKIADQRTDSYERVQQARNMELSFASNAVVRVVGRDNETIISEETANEFLLRISTARRLQGISVIDEEKNSQGKIIRLVVHEVYSRKNN